MDIRHARAEDGAGHAVAVEVAAVAAAARGRHIDGQAQLFGCLGRQQDAGAVFWQFIRFVRRTDLYIHGDAGFLPPSW